MKCLQKECSNEVSQLVKVLKSVRTKWPFEVVSFSLIVLNSSRRSSVSERQ